MGRCGRRTLGGDRFSSGHWVSIRTAANRSTPQSGVGTDSWGWADRSQHKQRVWSPEKAQVRSTPLSGRGPQGQGARAEGESL